jgi:hypothetical protein
VKKQQNGRKSLRRLKPTVGCNASKSRRIINFYTVLWPARATTKISLAAPRHHLGSVSRMGVPERGGGQKAADCLNYLATQPLPYK